MGFLATLLLSVVFGILGVIRPRIATYMIIGMFVFFDELGPGFTTFRGAFPFNAYFVGFFGIRLIEVVTISAYLPMLVMAVNRRAASMPFGVERMIGFLFAFWIAVLMAVEFGIAGKPTYSDWRLIVSGAMQFHMLVLMFREEGDVEKLMRVFLIMLALKASYGLAMWAGGMGTMTPRGKLPFFWDSKQVEAFGLGVVILTAYLLNYASVDARHRLIPFGWALLMWLILLAAVGGSIRRTIWVVTFLGMFGAMIMSRRTTVMHYFVILLVGSITITGVLLAPGLEKFRDHMGKYVESMNLFDDSQRVGNIENDVHLNNVEQYFKMITEKTDILALGVHGPSGVHYYEILIGAYSEGGYRLGMAHNGLLRSVLFFGIFGMLFYIAFFWASLARTLRVYWRAPEDHGMKHVALACGVYLFLDFASTVLFVPPFYTSSKGLFYTFFEVFVLGVVAHALARSPASATRAATASQMNMATGAVR